MRYHFRWAAERDLDAVWRFYEEVCAAQAESEYSPGWHIGIYPAPEDLREHTESGELFVVFSDARVAAAAVLTARDDPMYADVRWQTPCSPEEAAAVHLLAVRPDLRRTGLSGTLVEALVAEARAQGKRCIRLDVVKGNLPAERLYLRRGFRFVEERSVYYEDTGEIAVRLFELQL